jgi:hypothetical protein
MTLTETYDQLMIAFEALAKLRGNLESGIGADSALAIGEALGNIAKAKALVNRDIDMARSK